MKKLLLLVALLSAGWARAQTACPAPKLKAFHNKQEIKTTGSAMVPTMTLALTNDPACATPVSYQIIKAEMTLIRGRRPLLPARTIQGSEVDLTSFAKLSQPGDRLYIEVHDAVATTAGGQPKPYKRVAGQYIAFNWVLGK
ncbi:hypothetical protein SAMN00120144_0057 [Hymenobacter roseosalivarius DSM 11622]|uniref:Gliding motility-associated protein GldM C-terminal domain-containing protein n=1 Tax=Hymenobacter roseosalivarius DSM 11622 TaxID=645990 RepID=A0A1W1W0T1_9BACT|nr:hypothetical protein [Hymenobacter roseosalivarius]SMB99186.1 hypothetical protein SAMN00120144_0057 [Hymenobacter roseosalivarius DSM 11622]